MQRILLFLTFAAYFTFVCFGNREVHLDEVFRTTTMRLTEYCGILTNVIPLQFFVFINPQHRLASFHSTIGAVNFPPVRMLR